MSQRIVLNNDVLIALLTKRGDIVNEFPFMKNAATQARKPKGGCGGCGRRKQQALNNALDQVRRQISNLTPERQKRLKQLLDATEVRLYHNNAKGQTVKTTI